jgi:hypothetical protein
LALAVARLHGAASLPAELNCCFRFAHEKQLPKRSGAHWQHWHGSSVCGQTQPMGEPDELKKTSLAQASEGAMVARTMGGRMHVRWDDTAQATPHGQIVFFAEILATASPDRRTWLQTTVAALRWRPERARPWPTMRASTPGTRPCSVVCPLPCVAPSRPRPSL